MSGTFSLPLLNKEPDLICGYIPGIYITRFQSAQLQREENSMDLTTERKHNDGLYVLTHKTMFENQNRNSSYLAMFIS